MLNKTLLAAMVAISFMLFFASGIVNYFIIPGHRFLDSLTATAFGMFLAFLISYILDVAQNIYENTILIPPVNEGETWMAQLFIAGRKYQVIFKPHQGEVYVYDVIYEGVSVLDLLPPEEMGQIKMQIIRLKNEHENDRV